MEICILLGKHMERVISNFLSKEVSLKKKDETFEGKNDDLKSFTLFADNLVEIKFSNKYDSVMEFVFEFSWTERFAREKIEELMSMVTLRMRQIFAVRKRKGNFLEKTESMVGKFNAKIVLKDMPKKRDKR